MKSSYAMKFSIRLLYLYLFSFIGLIIAVIGTVQFVDLGLKIYVFKDADKYEYAYPARVNPDGTETKLTEKELGNQKEAQEREQTRQRQRQASTAISMILVGLPLYKYHWGLVKKEGKA